MDPPKEVTLREYLETILAERDRLYDVRFRAAEEAVAKALKAKEHNAGTVIAVIGTVVSVTMAAVALFMAAKK